MPHPELDVRGIRKAEKHPRIFAEFDALAVDQSFVLISNHDPQHLRREFDTECPGSFDWAYQQRGPVTWRILITKRASTPLPRIVGSTRQAASVGSEVTGGGAIWKLEMDRRQLDSNVIRLLPGDRIDQHAGPDLDVLVHVLSGAGDLVTEAAAVPLAPGALVWLPRRSRRGFTAGPSGLCYLTVHLRRPGISIATRPSDG